MAFPHLATVTPYEDLVTDVLAEDQVHHAVFGAFQRYSALPAAITGTATAGSTGQTLVASGATFVSSGVVVGDVVYNSTDASYAIVKTVSSETQIVTTPLKWGSTNAWASTNTFAIRAVPSRLIVLTAADGANQPGLYLRDSWNTAWTVLDLNGAGTSNEAKGANIASETTTDIAAATGNFIDVTGTTTITGLGTAVAGAERTVRFTGALTLTHNATSLILPGGANITTANGDVAKFRSLGSGNWVCVTYSKASGAPIVTWTVIDQMFGDGSDGALVVTSGTTNLVYWTVYQYSSINISAGATLSTSSSNGKLLIKCKWTATIAGSINLSWKGNDGTLVSTLFGKSLTVGSAWSGGNGASGAGSTGWSQAWGTGGTGASWYGGGGGGGGGQSNVWGNGGNGWTPGGTGGTSPCWSVWGNAYSSNGSSATSGTTGAGWNGGLSSGGGWSWWSGSQASCWGGGGAGGTKWLDGWNLILYANDVSGSGSIVCSGSNWGNGGSGGSGFQAWWKGGGGAWGGGWSLIFVSWNSAFAWTTSVTFWNGWSVWSTGNATGATAGSNGTAGNSYVARIKDIF